MPPSNNTSRDRRQHSEKCVQQKITPLKCCPRPSSMEHFKCPSGVGLPHRYPEQLATPFWLRKNAKKKKKWVLVCHRSLLFRPNFPKTQAAIGDHTRKWKIYFFVHFGGVFLFFYFPPSFFAYFSSFFCPNKSYAKIFRGFPQ